MVGNNLTFTVNDGSGHTGSTTFNVQSAYSGWSSNQTSGGLPFEKPFTDTAMTSNPDGDNLTNLQEFAFGMDPTSSTTRNISFVNGGNVTQPGVPILMNFANIGQAADYRAVFARRKNHLAVGIVYAAEFSVDLSLWTASATGLNVLTDTNSASDTEAVSIPYPSTVPLQAGGAQQPPKFFRVRVTSN